MTDTNPAHNQTPDSPSADAAAEGATPTVEATQDGPSLAEQLEAAKKEATNFQAHYLRAMADLENYRKRAIREKDEIRQYGVTRVLEDLLPVVDNLNLGLSAARLPNAELKTLVGGVEMVLSQFKTALDGHGLKEISPAGQPFDPHQHEAISHLPSTEVPAEHVLTVVRTGYSLNGRLLRPATVVISSGPAPKDTA